MEGIKINIKGLWAHFKRPETNNSPLTHDFITKTALIGLIGAMTGKTREEMKNLFPILSEDLKYGVQINTDVIKQSWGFTLRNVSSAWDKAPKQMEFLRDVDCDVLICLVNERSKNIYDLFVTYCEGGYSCYEPILGIHNCPAEIEFLSTHKMEYHEDGIFKTKGFVTSKHVPVNAAAIKSRLGFDKVPTYQNNDFWNLPEKYISVVYPSEGKSIEVRGFYYDYDGENWCLI
jgi:CRISPR-associated protein Cas5h